MSKPINLTHVLGKPFEIGTRGPHAYDCVGVCGEVAFALFGEDARASLPGGAMQSIASDALPRGWTRVGGELIDAQVPGDVILTERMGDEGIEHHVWSVVSATHMATCDRTHGAVLLPRRAIRETIIGVYRWDGAA